MMNSPSAGSKPRSLRPHQLLNGGPKQQTSVNLKERGRLRDSIESSYVARQPIDLEAPHRSHSSAHHPPPPPKPSRLSGESRNHEVDLAVISPPSESRPASPYTLHPPIDFDGLSWPSKFVRISQFPLAERKGRHRNQAKARRDPRAGSCAA